MRTLVACAALLAASGCTMFQKKAAAPEGPVYERIPAKERKVHAGGGMEVYTRQDGYGPVVVVVNNGPGSSSDVIAPDLDAYKDSVRWLFYDQRGTGRSASPSSPDGWSLDAQAEDLEAIRTTLQLPKLDILAHGFGATFALAYAEKHPDKVGKLLLVNPIASAEQRKRADEIRASRITPDDKKAFAELEKSGMKKKAPERYREQQVALAIRVGTCKHDGPQPRGRSDEHKEAARATLTALGDGFDVAKDAAKVTAKTGIFMGRCGFLSQIAVEDIKNKIKDAQLLVFESSGMYPFVEEKDLFEKGIRTFFQSPPKPAHEATETPEKAKENVPDIDK